MVIVGMSTRPPRHIDAALARPASTPLSTARSWARPDLAVGVTPNGRWSTRARFCGAGLDMARPQHAGARTLWANLPPPKPLPLPPRYLLPGGVRLVPLLPSRLPSGRERRPRPYWSCLRSGHRVQCQDMLRTDLYRKLHGLWDLPSRGLWPVRPEEWVHNRYGRARVLAARCMCYLVLASEEKNEVGGGGGGPTPQR